MQGCFGVALSKRVEMGKQKWRGGPWVLPFGKGSMGRFFLSVKGFVLAKNFELNFLLWNDKLSRFWIDSSVDRAPAF